MRKSTALIVASVLALVLVGGGWVYVENQNRCLEIYPDGMVRHGRNLISPDKLDSYLSSLPENKGKRPRAVQVVSAVPNRFLFQTMRGMVATLDDDVTEIDIIDKEAKETYPYCLCAAYAGEMYPWYNMISPGVKPEGISTFKNFPGYVLLSLRISRQGMSAESESVSDVALENWLRQLVAQYKVVGIMLLTEEDTTYANVRPVLHIAKRLHLRSYVFSYPYDPSLAKPEPEGTY